MMSKGSSHSWIKGWVEWWVSGNKRPYVWLSTFPKSAFLHSNNAIPKPTHVLRNGDGADSVIRPARDLFAYAFMNHVLTFTFTFTFTFTIFHLTFFKYFHQTNMDSALIFTCIFIIRSELSSVKKSLVN